MVNLWQTLVDAAMRAFGVSHTKATVVLVVLLLWMLGMIIETWFLWACLLAATAAVLGAALAAEHTLRVYYAFRDIRESGQWDPSDEEKPAPAVPDRLPTSCSDAQGRIRTSEEDGQNYDGMAEGILRNAVAASGHSRGWLRFPAICRTLPQLDRGWQVLANRLRI